VKSQTVMFWIWYDRVGVCLRDNAKKKEMDQAYYEGRPLVDTCDESYKEEKNYIYMMT